MRGGPTRAGMLREVVPFKRVPAILNHFGTEALNIMQFDP